MDNKNQQQANIIITVQDVQLCRVHEDSPQLIEKTDMNLATLPNGQVFLSIGYHFFTLQKSIPIYLTAFETQRSYLYSFIGEIYSIILQVEHKKIILLQNSTCQHLYEKIDEIFNTSALLVLKDRQGSQFEDGGQVMTAQKRKSAWESVNIQPYKIFSMQRKSPWQFLTNGASVVGNTLSKGISEGGQFMASGIVTVGIFIESKITSTTEPMKISDNTRQNVKMVKDASGKALEVSGAMIKQIVEMNIMMAKMMASTFCEVSGINKNKETSDSSPKKTEIKNFAQASLLATLGVLDSLDKAAEQVGKALGQQSTIIIEKKYGKDASDLFDEGVQVAGNVGKTYKDIKQAEIKAIARATAKETFKQVGEQI